MKKLILAVILFTISSLLYASTATISNVTITRTLLENGNYGNCMILLSKAPGLSCSGRWVSFSCDGTYQPRDSANMMFDSAQMALALGKKVNVRVDDLKKHNGYCFAYRIDVLK